MKYKIEFFDFWHLGSGVSAGATLDALVIKDINGIPYVPAKTMKGILREMVEVIDEEKAKIIFGQEGSNQAKSYFSNATLQEEEQKALRANPSLKKHLYDKITSTKIDKKSGLALDNTLREIEVVVPLTLYGEIESQETALLKKAMQMVKQIGLNRNRGLGRCQISEVKDAN